MPIITVIFLHKTTGKQVGMQITVQIIKVNGEIGMDIRAQIMEPTQTGDLEISKVLLTIAGTIQTILGTVVILGGSRILTMHGHNNNCLQIK